MLTRLIPALLLLIACGGEYKGDSGSTTDDPGTTTPTFTEVRDDVLLPSCGFATCHGAGGEAGDLLLDEATSYANMVDVESSAAPGEILVIPGDADNSYLVKKLVGDPSIVDDAMPPPSGGLSPESITMIQEWIDAGAADD